MGEYATQSQIQAFLSVLRSTAQWLDQHVAPASPKPHVSLLDAKLRKYLKHCRKHALAGRVPLADLERRRQRILDASFVLWQSLRPES
jgi:hypothetical protein